ncbi:MFS transporter [Rhizobium alvei]|uniref:MFS transporter n=1 Tax=Rhizobium alvei TaxID=1132659 RepID=A0ABT8YJE6_9HYPH|nr:MFS transporter [Rhizobium alvei]MDO6963458.1 MFS transporter [Rhizobium alvei]
MASIVTQDAQPLRARTGFFITLAGVTIMMAGASAPSPFYPVLREQMGFSPAMMTAIFAVYTVALLLSLLVAGSISDHVGRRPALSAAFALLALSVYLFWQAKGVDGLLIARGVQGLACGVLLSTLSAAAVDLEPVERPGSASVWNAVLPLIGLGVGSLFAGAVMDYGSAPMDEVFGTFLILYIALTGLVWIAPETAPRHEGLLQALVPRVGVPSAARRAFWRGTPAVMAGWATGGLYLSLGAPIMAYLGVTDFLLQALVITLLAVTGALASFIARKAPARKITLFGTSALAIGTSIAIAALLLQSLPAYLVAVIVVGMGFGTCFLGILRSVVPITPADERSELFASLFTISYIAFGLPTLIAGSLLPILGFSATITGYGTLIVLMSTVAGLMRKFGDQI